MSKMTGNELELIKIIWEKGEVTAREIHVESLKFKQREYNTINTILTRMVEKGLITRRKIGPVYLYSPKKNKKKHILELINNFVENVLDGHVAPIFKYMVENAKISREELQELKKIINEIED